MNFNFCVLTDKKTRVDIYLSALFNEFSRSYIQKMIDRGQVKVNNNIVNKNIKIFNKDEINLDILIEKLDEIKPEKMNFDVIFEDKQLIILNKDAGINVHPVPGIDGNKNTLVNGILDHCKEDLPTIGGINRPGIVHRLDKDTSGLIMIAKTDKMMNYLSKIIKDRNIDKYYIAVVFGKVKNTSFKIESYIGRDKNNRLKMTTVDPINPKIAITYGEVIDYIDNKYTLLKIKIETGRTHQIRVHLSSIGYPIIGDKTYGNLRVNKEVATRYQIHRQALHAYQLDLELYNKNVSFKAGLKKDMQNIIKNNKTFEKLEKVI